MAMYIKTVTAQDSATYRSEIDRRVRYEIGGIVTAQCLYSDHPAPHPDCTCGIYSVRLSLRGLARLRRRYLFPPTPSCALLLVQPIGRSYTDGTVVRSERLLTLSRILDWHALVPRQLQDLDDDLLRYTLEVLDDLQGACVCAAYKPYRLAQLRHFLGKGCYPPERMRKIARRYGSQSPRELAGYCPFEAWHRGYYYPRARDGA